MNKDDDKKTINQIAWILNYQPNIGQQHIHMGNQTIKDVPIGEEAEAEEVVSDTIPDQELVSELKPIFYNNEEYVRRFLKEIRGMATEDITDLVNRWVKGKLISDYGNSRKGTLWGILHKAGLYTRTKSNWNGRVK